MQEEDGATHVTTDQARSGSTPHMTRYILGFSLVAVIVAFAIILLI